MSYDELLNNFSQFGLAILLGILIGLERELRDGGRSLLGLRDFVLFSLLGASS
ncbi:MAG: MgtC/SapB family protein, partial [Gammaproteobacteria bacterium]|nr:MgtC/SapB family protein [Gammaproteobacteria bacterium]